MKKIRRASLSIAVLVIALAFGLTGAIKVRAATAVNLNTAGNFAVLAGSAIIDSSPSTIVGNVGLDPNGGASIPALTCGEITGTLYDNDGLYTGGAAPGSVSCRTTDAGLLTTAKSDLLSAYGVAAGETPVTTYPPVHIFGTETLTPGVYNDPSSLALSGDLTLDGGGDSNAIFVFQAGSTLTSASNIHVNLINGAQACNVFWQVGTSATLGTGSHFQGNILADQSITDNGGSTVFGRLLAMNAAVTLDNTHLTKATCAVAPHLTVTKIVNNTHGGTKVVSDFPLFIDGSSVTSGVASTTTAGLHTISETSNTGYAATFGGDCSVTGTINLIAGTSKFCTITNDDVAPQLTVTKIVVGGSKSVSDFPLFVDGSSVTSGIATTTNAGSHTISETSGSNYTSAIGGDCSADGAITLAAGSSKLCTITNTFINPGGAGASVTSIPVPPLIDVVKVPSPLALPLGPGMVKYTYTLHNIGTVPVSNITMIDDSCSSATFISGDNNNDAKLDTSETWTYQCSTMLSQTHTNTVVATGWANGISATDVANATVVVGVPIVPPLIHVTKVPNPLALLAGGGLVTYTEKITNPGTVALSNVQLSDDKCGPMKYISGDTNNDSKLDTNETWTYTCSSNLSQTTTNTAVATGEANGLTVKDFAIATVVVAGVVPKLPSTGFAPDNSSTMWIALLASLAVVFASAYVVSRNKARS